MATQQVQPEEITIEEKLKALYHLQTVATEIDKIKILRGELPLEVQDLQDEIAGYETRIENYNNEVLELEKLIANRKNLKEEASAKIAKCEEQQNNVRNNREYDSLSKEIEYQKLDIELCDKKIGEHSAQIAVKKEEIEKSKTYVEDRKIDLKQKKSELNEIIAETKQEEERLMQKGKECEEKIEDRLLLAFKRIRKNLRNGLAVVPIQRDACGGCFNKIPPQRQLDIRLRKKIIVCEYCGRILVDPELAETHKSENN